MKVAEFVKTTTIEWEGMVSSLLVLGEKGMDVEDVLRYLEEREGIIDAVIIDSIERTTPDELIPLLKRLKLLGMKVRLVTDCGASDALDDLIGARYVDSVMVRLDKGKDADVIDTVSLLTEYGIETEYRTVLDCSRMSVDDIQDYSRLIKGSKLYVLVQSKDNPFKKKDALLAVESARKHVKRVLIRQ